MLFTAIESHEACRTYSTASARLQAYDTDRSRFM